MKIIGVELRYRHPMRDRKEIAMFAVDIPLPPLEEDFDFVGGPRREIEITVHTSEGDVTMQMVLPPEPPRSSFARKITDWFDRVRT